MIALLALLAWIGLVPLTAGADVVFEDGFESGGLGSWTSSIGVTVQQTDVHAGLHAARASAGGSAAYASTQLLSASNRVSFRLWFRVGSMNPDSVSLMILATSTGTQLVTVGLSSKAKLMTRNRVTGVNVTSSTVVTRGVWHQLETRVAIDGTASSVQVLYDGAPVPRLTKPDSLGTAPIGRALFGDTQKRTFDIAFDDVSVETLAEGDTTPPASPSGVTATAVNARNVSVSWTASPDPDVAGYGVYRNGATLAFVPPSSTQFSDTGVVPGTTYGYSVDAFDAAGNHSGPAGPVTVATPDAGYFYVTCAFSHTLSDDPIVFPFQPGASHQHDFFGNTSTDAFSTRDSMTPSGTSCGLSADTAGYWTPRLITAAGTSVTPTKVNAYYRVPGGVDPFNVQAFPADLKIVSGGDSVGDPEHVYWTCGGSNVPFSTPQNCGSGKVVKGTVQFPSCWDGVHLDSPDHRAHLVHPSAAGCPSGHPVALPKLVLTAIYPVTNGTGATLSSGAATTLHADFWNTWQQAELERRVAECLNAGVVCGQLSG